MITSKFIKNSLLLKLIYKNQPSRIVGFKYHTSAANYRRRGPVSDVGLPELIVDKPPDSYQTIKQKLNNINYYDNPLNKVDIGHTKQSQYYDNFVKSAAILGNEFVSNKVDEEDFIDLEVSSDAQKVGQLEYEKISSLYPFSKEYVDNTISLAHHYGIYRDLFYQESFKLTTRDQLISSNAKDEVKVNPELHPVLYDFAPLVPIDAEFLINVDSEDEMIGQKSYRGNLIPPQYGSKSPSVIINSSAIGGEFTSNESIVDSGKSVILNSGKSKDNHFYTLALVNLDSHFSDSGVCHWMLTNIHNQNGETNFETIVKYLPVYGIRGFGYHRYAFVLFEHNNKLANLDTIDNYDLAQRKFNGLKFMENSKQQNKDLEIKPIGLSWFQTFWNDSCSDVFYNYLDMRSPVYEYVFPEQITHFKQNQFPGRAPFNIYLDYFRDPKELAKSVLVKRLRSIDPYKSYETEKMYPQWTGRQKLANIYRISKDIPSWLKTDIRLENAKIGRYRGLRPASATLPYNNNADLDNPNWPCISEDLMPLNVPNPYPDGKRRPKPLRTTLWSKPLLEHHSIRVPFPDSLKADDKKKLNNKSKQ